MRESGLENLMSPEGEPKYSFTFFENLINDSDEGVGRGAEIHQYLADNKMDAYKLYVVDCAEAGQDPLPLEALRITQINNKPRDN